jgi:hypothetical protein
MEHGSKDTVVVVLGMHRSGTSLTASLLHQMGVDMGRNCDWRGPANPRGFYEDIAFLRTNEYILRLAEGSWYNPPPMDRITEVGRILALQRHIEVLLRAKRGSGLWGWKDPRTALTIPIYMSYLDKPVFVCTHRNPLSIATSLHRRDNIPIEYGLKLTATYESRVLSCLLEYTECPRIHLSYEGLLRNRDHVKRLGDFVGLPVTDKAYDLIDHSLEHNV